MYTATLRPASEWVGGVPTLDALETEAQPYAPGSPNRRASIAAMDAYSLTLHDMLELMDRLPERAAMLRNRARATAPLYAWLRAHPTRAHLYPAEQVAHDVRRMETRGR